jgi:two-component system sensor histidine kinase KdpD
MGRAASGDQNEQRAGERGRSEEPRPAGKLSTYLGTAPGVGKTYAMLVEARRRAKKGRRVVVGWIEQHGRPETRSQLGSLELVPPRTVRYRGRDFEDLDVEAVMASGADVVVVDELAHTTADGSRRRWEDVAVLIDAGLDVLTTLNVTSLSSMRDHAARVVGVAPVESVPDELVRAGEVVLVDLPAEVLRRRIASGRVYTTERVGGALGDYFKISNLEALSALGQAWLDGTADDVAEQLLAERGDAPACPLVVAGISDSEWGEWVIRRAARLALADNAELLVVHVRLADGVAWHGGDVLARYGALVAEMGGSYTEVEATTPADGLAAIARARGASRVVVARHRSRLGELTRGSVASQLRRLLPGTTITEVRRSDRKPPPEAWTATSLTGEPPI